MASIFRPACNITGILLRGAQCQRCSFLHHQSHRASLSILTGKVNQVPSKPTVASQTATIDSSGSRWGRTIPQSNFSTFTGLLYGLRNRLSSPSSTLLKVPQTVVLTQTCGMKLKGVLNKRCKHCRITRRKGNMYVLCKENPRHKQKLIKPTGWRLPGVWNNKWY